MHGVNPFGGVSAAGDQDCRRTIMWPVFLRESSSPASFLYRNRLDCRGPNIDIPTSPGAPPPSGLSGDTSCP